MSIKQHSFNRSFVAVFLSLFLGIIFINNVASAPADEWRCDSYAREAVSANKENKDAGCGFTGLRWNSDKAGQKEWCLIVPKEEARKETIIRKKMLENCITKKASADSDNNQLNLPKACTDASNVYTPVRKIITWYRYKKSLYMPIKETGLIQYDLNNDKQKDYLFIEKNKKKNVQLTACLSNKNGYQRELTDVSFTPNPSDSTSSEQYSISLKKGLINIDINYFGHNEGSSRTLASYAYNTEKKQFELESTDSSNAGVIDPETSEAYPIYVPKAPLMRRPK